MRRATQRHMAGSWVDDGNAVSATLDLDQRNRRRIKLQDDQGEAFLLDLPKAVTLRQGDGLTLQDGGVGTGGRCSGGQSSGNRPSGLAFGQPASPGTNPGRWHDPFSRRCGDRGNGGRAWGNGKASRSPLHTRGRGL